MIVRVKFDWHNLQKIYLTIIFLSENPNASVFFSIQSARNYPALMHRISLLIEKETSKFASIKFSHERTENSQ